MFFEYFWKQTNLESIKKKKALSPTVWLAIPSDRGIRDILAQVAKSLYLNTSIGIFFPNRAC